MIDELWFDLLISFYVSPVVVWWRTLGHRLLLMLASVPDGRR